MTHMHFTLKGLIIGLAICVLNMIDAIITKLLVASGEILERNPMMDALISYGSWHFVGYKLLFSIAILIFATLYYEVFPNLFKMVLLVYSFLVAYEIIMIYA